ncbi:nuclear transport factor 2 family protein [Yinghuangia sp. ASG 101]|uniref:nuclear transport factor 2 family protein n=1 Tax=Yinghuangia sp. ASG 101 TaxID=2896848 RepID=UPI001E53D595|nr:nuclear transport factor 2 family protein [Yinghuangia sp. ASG 101]UGQ10194.1 nuclear transport factor 2 family protein [Yinghuangia sp. ASG 101]
MTTTDPEIRARNTAALRRALAAVGDVSAQLAEYTDDAVLEFPYAAPPVRVEGRARISAYLTAALAVFEMRLTVTRVHECADPDVLIAEYTSEGRVTTTGKPYANTYISVVAFHGGLIAHQREFYNPSAAAEALAP